MRLLGLVLIAGFAGLVGIAFSQAGRTGGRVPGQMAARPGERVEPVEFQPVRVVYRTFGGGGSRGYRNPWWAIDYPAAEEHFLPALARLTKLSVAEDSRHLEVIDPEIYNHPFLFLQQPGQGQWAPNPREAEALRDYLERGGFLLVDDFHGVYEWDYFRQVMERVMPGRTIIDIPEEDSLIHVVYSLEDRLQIPGKRHLQGGRGQGFVSMAGPAHWRGLYDQRGRLLVGMNFNMDMGDAWEHADDPDYPADMTGQAYRLGINYVVYAMTH